MIDTESLAKVYHEICREMVNKQIGLITKPTQPYIEWADLTEQQKEGRRFIARELFKRFLIIENGNYNILGELNERLKLIEEWKKKANK